MTLALGVLVSGSGTNLQAILDAISQGRLDARVRIVLSNKPDVPALGRAERAGVPTRVVSHRQFDSREAFDQALLDALTSAGAEWVVLAGFMRVLTPGFLRAFPSRVVNIHPALLPAFPGTHAQQQALRYGVKVTGCTVHFVDEGVDTGPIIAQRALPIEADDDATSLAARLLHVEHELLVEVLGWIAADRVRVEAGAEGHRPRVVIR
ncbi:MAG: phosphoribosylglycinamide formyltransferase [Myxococcales bacterium]|nr:phosphoribosylglycinamide formyltransferase [Myxococcales bacterium]MCB9580033.1 phosphoribosylglycinamide formyltransferase [Polyangiaceae bacterium]